MTSYAHLALCISGIYVSFLVWAVLQEKLSTTPYTNVSDGSSQVFKEVVFLNSVQSVFSSISSLLFLLATRKSNASLLGLPKGKERSLILNLALVALLSTCSSPLGFIAARSVSYPTALLAKSCKLLPVMLVSVLVYRRGFPLQKYVLVGIITLGLYLFVAGKPSTRRTEATSYLGYGLLFVNLFMDGLTNATQDAVFRNFAITGPQMMFFMNVFASLYSLVYLLASNTLVSALQFLQYHPAVTKDILLYGLCGSLGQLFIFSTLSSYGSLTLVTITVTRKMATMLMSVILFNHSLVAKQWAGVGLVFAALISETLLKSSSKQPTDTPKEKRN